MNGGKKPMANACLRVDRAGENNAAWAKATRSAGVFVCWLMAGAAVAAIASCAVGSCASVWLVWWNVSGKVHSPCVLRGHVSLLPLGILMVQQCCSNVTVHPLSHKGATASRELWSCGKMCVSLAFFGRPWIGTSAVWVEYIYCWLATWTGMGDGVC